MPDTANHPTGLDRQALSDLRDFQLEQIRQGLTSEAARQAWLAQGAAAMARVLGMPLGRLIDRQSLGRALDVSLSEATAVGVVRPLARALADESARHTPAFDVSFAELLGAQACDALYALAEHPDVVDEALLRAITQDPAMEAVMRDVLYDALVAFNERTNPFVAPWGVPALLDSLPRIGRGALRKAFDTVRAEFERRLEPETRRFLETFARKSLDRSIDIFVEKAADPQLVALRRHAVATVAAVPVSRHAWSEQDARQQHWRVVVSEGVAHSLGHVRVSALLQAALDDWWQRHEGTELGALLAQLSIELPDPEPLLSAAWPAVQAIASGDAILSLAGELIDASHEAWLASR